MLIHKQITQSVIGAFFDVYNTLGFGFLEAIYAAALERELTARGHAVVRELAVHVMYKGDSIGFQRLDMVVDQRVVVEIKSTHALAPSAQRQLYNYLRATNLEVGLLLHFGPEAKFFRCLTPARRNDPDDPDNPAVSDSAIAPRPLPVVSGRSGEPRESEPWRTDVRFSPGFGRALVEIAR